MYQKDDRREHEKGYGYVSLPSLISQVSFAPETRARQLIKRDEKLVSSVAPMTRRLMKQAAYLSTPA